MRRKIQKLLEEEVNPYVADHGGRIDLVDFVNGIVYVQMSGGCQGCSSSTATLQQGVERLLKEQFGDRVKEIVDTTDHNSGESPYYA